MEEDKRRRFGGRFLTEEDNVFKHNAWDDVEWTEEQKQKAQEQVDLNAKEKLPEEKREHYESEAHNYWDKFYNIHDNKFFKDRNWLFTELPELGDLDKEERSCALMEIGCGSGSTVYPILQTIRNKNFKLYCCDFAPKAVELVRTNPDFEPDRCFPFVCNVTKDEDWEKSPVVPESLDFVLMIFALSAMEPGTMEVAVARAFKYLKPGGLLFFRDYGEHDLAQLRFKAGKCIDDKLYVRGDGTRCYFFNQEFMEDLFIKKSGFKEKHFKVDRRLQVNRGKQLKMFRVWVQGIYEKPQ